MFFLAIEISACEGLGLNLKCPVGRFIFVRSVQVLLNSNNCAAKSSVIKCSQTDYQNKSKNLARKCRNKEICDIKVNRDIFGSECDGDVRYVKVTYSCSRYLIDENNQIIMNEVSSTEKNDQTSDEVLSGEYLGQTGKDTMNRESSSDTTQILSERNTLISFQM